jgi:hypothetical protein
MWYLIAYKSTIEGDPMNIFRTKLCVSFGLLTTSVLFSGCNAIAPVKASPATAATPAKASDVTASNTPVKSIEEIANEAMQSKGQLSREQIDALIRANAKCKPNDPRYNS